MDGTTILPLLCYAHQIRSTIGQGKEEETREAGARGDEV